MSPDLLIRGVNLGINEKSQGGAGVVFDDNTYCSLNGSIAPSF